MSTTTLEAKAGTKANEEDQYFTINELAARVKCHPDTIRKEIYDGNIEAFKLCKSYRITLAAVQDYEKRNSCNPKGKGKAA